MLAAFQLPAFAWPGFSVTLGWDPSPDAAVTGYNVYYGANSSGDYTNVLAAGNATNAVIPGLRAGVTYFFAATALDAVGQESDFSNEVSYRREFLPADVVVTASLPLYLPDGSTNIMALFCQTNPVEPMRFWKISGTGFQPVIYSVLTSTDLFSWQFLYAIPSNAIPGQLLIRKP